MGGNDLSTVQLEIGQEALIAANEAGRNQGGQKVHELLVPCRVRDATI